MSELQVAILAAIRPYGGGPVNLLRIGTGLVGQGFDQNEIVTALFALKASGMIDVMEGNRVRLLNLPMS